MTTRSTSSAATARSTISYSTALSKGVKVTDENEWNKLLKSALYFQDLTYNVITMKICADYKLMMAKVPKWRPPKSLKEFHAADRTSVLNCIQVEYEKHHEVLEMVLTKNHSVGARLSRKHTAIVECPDQEEYIPLPPPPPKGKVEQMCDSVRNVVRKVTLEPRIEPPPKGRWEPVESRVYEIHLCQEGPIRTQSLSKKVAVFSRRASFEEIRPYQVEFHISQKAWYEQLMFWLTRRAETAALHSNRYVNLPAQCGPDMDGALVLSHSMGSVSSYDAHGKKVPIEIAVKKGEKHKPRTLFKAAPSMETIWIPDYDVVLGVDKIKAATTLATEIMKTRVVPFFVDKQDLRPSQVHVMTLMLQEELKDDQKFADKDIPMANFWMKVADCNDQERKKEGGEAKWLKKDNGDFTGPFVHASDNAIHQAAVNWVQEYALQRLEAALVEVAPDPEPSPPPTVSPSPPPPSESPPLKPTPPPSPRPPATTTSSPPRSPRISPLFAESREEEAVTCASQEYRQPLFDMTGPIESLDLKAREVCQEWVNNSETLLIKAAKKTLIDSFQADFHSFLFLFQLQLKRIKGGYESKEDGAAASQADDTSWVSAEPSVAEEDVRVADIERACIAFMNQMGNDMVKHYDRLSGEHVHEVEQEQRDGPLGTYLLKQANSRGSSSIQSRQSASRSGGSVQSRQKLAPSPGPQFGSDPALFYRDAPTTLAETSLDLSNASTVRRFTTSTKPAGHANAKTRTGLPPLIPTNTSGTSLRSPPRSTHSPRRRHDDTDYSEEDGSIESYPTYDQSGEESMQESQSFEPSLDDTYEDTEEEERRYYRRRHRRRHREVSPPSPRSRDCNAGGRGRYDYDSPTSHSRSYVDDDTYPTVETEPLESLTLTPSELSLEDKPPRNDQSWGLTFWI